MEIANKIESTIYQTENLLETFKDNSALTEEDKVYFNSKIEELKKIKEEKNFSNVTSLLDEITKRWNEISVKAYTNGNAQGNATGTADFMNMFNQTTNPFNSNFKQDSNSTDNIEEQGE